MPGKGDTLSKHQFNSLAVENNAGMLLFREWIIFHKTGNVAKGRGWVAKECWTEQRLNNDRVEKMKKMDCWLLSMNVVYSFPFFLTPQAYGYGFVRLCIERIVGCVWNCSLWWKRVTQQHNTGWHTYLPFLPSSSCRSFVPAIWAAQVGCVLSHICLHLRAHSITSRHGQPGWSGSTWKEGGNHFTRLSFSSPSERTFICFMNATPQSWRNSLCFNQIFQE